MALDILIVDDEQDIRDLVSGVLEDEGFTTRTAADSNEALQALSDRRPSLALLDVWLQGSKLDGLQLLEEIKRRDPSLPVLIISGHGNLDTAVAAIRQGAVDFIEKPFDDEVIIETVRRALELRPAANPEIAQRLALLTPREREVLEGLVAGRANKVIAFDLDISPRTVEIHRARVMEKMQARSLSQLVRIALESGISPPPA
jgi:two-component system, LuxR family, response regulator FixJ